MNPKNSIYKKSQWAQSNDLITFKKSIFSKVYVDTF